VGQGGVGQVVGAVRGRDGPQQEAAVAVEQGQQVGHREAAALRLGVGLPEGLLEFGRVGHGEVGAVEEEEAVALPAAARVVVGLGAAASDDGLLQAVEEGDGQAGAGLAVGRLGEVEPGQVTQLGGGGVAEEHLAQEQVGGDNRGQGALAEAVAAVAADSQQQGLGDGLGEVALDATQGVGDSEHGGLRCDGVLANSIMTGGRHLAQANATTRP
jgi:hypothetical protein